MNEQDTMNMSNTQGKTRQTKVTAIILIISLIVGIAFISAGAIILNPIDTSSGNVSYSEYVALELYESKNVYYADKGDYHYYKITALRTGTMYIYLYNCSLSSLESYDGRVTTSKTTNTSVSYDTKLSFYATKGKTYYIKIRSTVNNGTIKLKVSDY